MQMSQDQAHQVLLLQVNRTKLNLCCCRVSKIKLVVYDGKLIRVEEAQGRGALMAVALSSPHRLRHSWMPLVSWWAMLLMQQLTKLHPVYSTTLRS